MRESEINPSSMGVAFAALAGNFVCSAPIVTASFGAFLIPVTNEFGWSRSSFAFVLTLVSAIGVVMLPLAGRVADRFGVRRVVLFGSAAFAAAISLAYFTGPRLLDFYVVYSLIAVASAFSSTVLLSRVVSEWFIRTRGGFLGVTAGIGNGLGCAAMPILVLAVIERSGWRAGYLALGVAIAIIGVPAMLLGLREKAVRSTDSLTLWDQPGITANEARQSGLFWLILGTIAVGGGALSAVFTHVVPLLTDRGLSQHATLVIMSIAISSTICQVALGRMLDQARAPRFSAAMIALSGLGVFALAHVSSAGMLATAGILEPDPKLS